MPKQKLTNLPNDGGWIRAYVVKKDIVGKRIYVKNFIEEDLVNFRAKAKEVAE